MSNRASIVLAVVISSICIYATFAQVPERPRNAAEGAIVAEQPPLRLAQELPLPALSASGAVLHGSDGGEKRSPVSVADPAGYGRTCLTQLPAQPRSACLQRWAVQRSEDERLLAQHPEC